MSYTKTNYEQQMQIVDFVKVAQSNGMTNIWACLPKKHPLIWNNRVGQIRKVKNALAFAFDELGNVTSLTTDLRVIQH